jgi:hypothetical protein
MEPVAAQAPGIVKRATMAMQNHPVITAVMVTCTVTGAIAGVSFLSGDWSFARRLAAGTVGGAGVGMCISGIKMIG